MQCRNLIGNLLVSNRVLATKNLEHDLPNVSEAEVGLGSMAEVQITGTPTRLNHIAFVRAQHTNTSQALLRFVLCRHRAVYDFCQRYELRALWGLCLLVVG